MSIHKLYMKIKVARLLKYKRRVHKIIDYVIEHGDEVTPATLIILYHQISGISTALELQGLSKVRTSNGDVYNFRNLSVNQRAFWETDDPNLFTQDYAQKVVVSQTKPRHLMLRTINDEGDYNNRYITPNRFIGLLQQNWAILDNYVMRLRYLVMSDKQRHDYIKTVEKRNRLLLHNVYRFGNVNFVH